MSQCKVCTSNRVVILEDKQTGEQKLRCRKCGYSEPVSLSLSKRKTRILSETTRMRISNSMNKTWKNRKKDPVAVKTYSETMSKAMKGKAQRQNSD